MSFPSGQGDKELQRPFPPYGLSINPGPWWSQGPQPCQGVHSPHPSLFPDTAPPVLAVSVKVLPREETVVSRGFQESHLMKSPGQAERVTGPRREGPTPASSSGCCHQLPCWATRGGQCPQRPAAAALPWTQQWVRRVKNASGTGSRDQHAASAHTAHLDPGHPPPSPTHRNQPAFKRQTSDIKDVFKRVKP